MWNYLLSEEQYTTFKAWEEREQRPFFKVILPWWQTVAIPAWNAAIKEARTDYSQADTDTLIENLTMLNDRAGLNIPPGGLEVNSNPLYDELLYPMGSQPQIASRVFLWLPWLTEYLGRESHFPDLEATVMEAFLLEARYWVVRALWRRRERESPIAFALMLDLDERIKLRNKNGNRLYNNWLGIAEREYPRGKWDPSIEAEELISMAYCKLWQRWGGESKREAERFNAVLFGRINDGYLRRLIADVNWDAWKKERRRSELMDIAVREGYTTPHSSFDPHNTTHHEARTLIELVKGLSRSGGLSLQEIEMWHKYENWSSNPRTGKNSDAEFCRQSGIPYRTFKHRKFCLISSARRTLPDCTSELSRPE